MAGSLKDPGTGSRLILSMTEVSPSIPDFSKGRAIEEESFAIIRRELGAQLPSGPEGEVVLRVIHATADLEFARNLRFHPRAIDVGLRVLREGNPIFCDVRMVEVAIAPSARRLGLETCCFIDQTTVIDMARQRGLTRAEAAVEWASKRPWSVMAIGNAPTALLRALELINQGRLKVGLLVGCPVGFVEAARAKELLSLMDFPFITCLGNKGGSPVAAAVVNALIRLLLCEGKRP